MARQKRVRWLVAASDDLAVIVGRIAEAAPQAAERFAEGVFNKVELLADFPHLGAICPYYRKARQLIYYTVHREEVVVRAFTHGARLFRSCWLRRED